MKPGPLEAMNFQPQAETIAKLLGSKRYRYEVRQLALQSERSNGDLKHQGRDSQVEDDLAEAAAYWAESTTSPSPT